MFPMQSLKVHYCFLFQQTTETHYPEILLIAINKNGVNLIHPQTKVSVLPLLLCKTDNFSNQLNKNISVNIFVTKVFSKEQAYSKTNQAYLLCINQWKFLFPCPLFSSVFIIRKFMMIISQMSYGHCATFGTWPVPST